MAGGQGAPLTPFLDWFLFKNKKKNMVLINIGGISNITFIPKDGSIKKVIGFDTGPGNMLIDQAMRYYYKKNYDNNGFTASKGTINHQILNKLLSHKYFLKKPPKSTGHEDFGGNYFNMIKKYFYGLKKKDIIVTLTAFTSYSILQQIKNILINNKVKEIVFSGGGAKNNTILNIFKNLLGENNLKIKLKTFDQLNLPFSSDAKEAVLIALLAYCYINKIPSNIPSVTGSKKRVILGNDIGL